MDIKRILYAASAKSDSHCSATLIVNVNAHSLAMQAEEIPTDLLPLLSYLLAIIKTCMDTAAHVSIKNVQVVHQIEMISLKLLIRCKYFSVDNMLHKFGNISDSNVRQLIKML